MDIHYNAFISYRHHPEDIRVATEIHRALERYRIPKAVRKNQKGSLRLFRDKDELPITSNLTDDITRALENSDFLIVICSTHTKESIWVQREIETFLKTHTYDKVLTVLVDGEPYETIPGILQYREAVDPDTGEMEKILIEPLSCDWRAGKKKAYREELPRLAAALLHCGYDELRQRQRQYKTRRMVTFFSLALAASVSLMAYFLYTSIKIQQANDSLQAANEEIREANQEIQEANVQIQNNLDEALRNQSEYLASAAGELYDNGDRLTAIALAMAALPSENNTRPYVADAEKILSEVLSLYSSNRDVKAAGVFNPGVTVDEFAVSDDGQVLYLLDHNKHVTVWNTDTYEQIGAFDLKAAYVNDLEIAGQNLIVSMDVDYYSGDPELCCYDNRGNLLWSVKECTDFALLDDDTLMVLQADVSKPAIIDFADLTTGVKVRDPFYLDETADISPYQFCQDAYVSGLPVILADSAWMDGYSSHYIVAADLQAGTVSCLRPDELWAEDVRETLYVTGASITEQGNILVMIGDESGRFNGKFGGVVTTSPANGTLLCYDGKDGTLMWQALTTSYSYSRCFTLCPIAGTGNIFCQQGNAFFVIEEATGKILSQCECTGNVLSVYLDAEKAYGIMDSRHYFAYYFDSNECNALPMMNGSLIQGEFANGFFFLEELSSQVMMYLLPPESGWKAFDGGAANISVYKELSDENLMAVITYDDELQIFDVNTHTILSSAAVEGRYSLSLLGFSEDKSKFYYANTYELMVLDVATGEVQTMQIPTGTDDYALVTGFYWMAEDALYYLVRQEQDLYLAELDLLTMQGNTTLFLKNVEGDSWSVGNNSGVTAASKDYAWVWDEGTLYEFDRESKTFRAILEGISEFPLCQYHTEKDILSVCIKDATLLYEPGGSQILRIPQGEHKDVHVQFFQDDILTINDEAKLIRYDWQGNRLSDTTLHAYNTFFSNIDIDGGEALDIDWNFTEDGDLILGLFNMGNIVDCSQWRSRAYIEYYEAYDPNSDIIISSSDSVLGFYPRYTTEQVLSIAQEQLGSYELTEEVKTYYGID